MDDVVIPPQAPDGLEEIISVFGDPQVKVVDGSWVVDPRWESASMTTIHHPLIPNPFNKLYVHHLVAQPLLRLLERWSARITGGDTYRVRTLGCFAPRAQRGSSGLVASTHTWGIAFDLNADSNRLISPCDPADPRRAMARDIPDAWVSDAVAEGWFWGGSFKKRFDPMHFQFCTGF